MSATIWHFITIARTHANGDKISSFSYIGRILQNYCGTIFLNCGRQIVFECRWYFIWIYLYIHLWIYYMDKYIRTFIGDNVDNWIYSDIHSWLICSNNYIFGYSFVKEKWHSLHTDLQYPQTLKQQQKNKS